MEYQRLTLDVRQPVETAMDPAKSLEPQPPRPAGIPRWLAIALAPIVGLVGFPAVHAGIPVDVHCAQRKESREIVPSDPIAH